MEATQLSNSGVRACCCASGSCSLTAFRSSSARAPSTFYWPCWKLTERWSRKTNCSTRCGGVSSCRKENLKVQVSRLRKALGGDGGLIRTEFGRGYRFTGALHSKVSHCPIRAYLRSGRALLPQNWGNRPGVVSVRASNRRGRSGHRYRRTATVAFATSTPATHDANRATID